MDERPVLEAVLLDAGGTLVRLDFEWMAAQVSDLGVPLTAERLRRSEIAGRRRYDASRGHPPRPGEPPPPLGSSGDTNAYFVGMLDAAEVPADVRDRALERWLDRQLATGLWMQPMEGARAALDALRKTGLRIGVVSNSDGRAEAHLRDCGVLEGVEFVIDSHRVGVEKPDPRIFAIALERLGVAPERSLFVGDIRCVDETGARAAGVHFVLIDPYGDYGPPGGPSVARIEDLPDWMAVRFELVASPRIANGAALESGAREEVE